MLHLGFVALELIMFIVALFIERVRLYAIAWLFVIAFVGWKLKTGEDAFMPNYSFLWIFTFAVCVAIPILTKKIMLRKNHEK